METVPKDTKELVDSSPSKEPELHTVEEEPQDEELDVEDQSQEDTQAKMMEKLQKIQQLQDLVTSYKLAKDFVSLNDAEIKKLMVSTKKGKPNFKKATRVDNPLPSKLTTKPPVKKFNKNATSKSQSLTMVDYTKKYLAVLETISRNLYPDDSNKLFKKRFEAICNGNFKEDAFRGKLMQFWTIVTKMRDGEIGMDDEDKIISAHLDQSPSQKQEDEEEEDSDMEMPDLVDATGDNENSIQNEENAQKTEN